MADSACQSVGPSWLELPAAEQLEDCLACSVRWRCLQYALDTKSTGVTMGGIVLGPRPLKVGR